MKRKIFVLSVITLLFLFIFAYFTAGKQSIDIPTNKLSVNNIDISKEWETIKTKIGNSSDYKIVRFELSYNINKIITKFYFDFIDKQAVQYSVAYDIDGIYRVSKRKLNKLPEGLEKHLSADTLFFSLPNILSDSLMEKGQHAEYALTYKGFGTYDIETTENYLVDKDGNLNKLSADDMPFTGYALILFALDNNTEGIMES